MSPEVQNLKERIVACLDEVEFLDIIGYTIADLVDLLEEEIEEHYTKLMASC